MTQQKKENPASKGDQTRRRILEAAAPIFNQQGFEGTSLSALMEATGLEKGGLYRHFSSKEQLAAEAFDFAWQSAYRERAEGLASIENSVDKLKQFIANFVERRPSVPGGCPVFNTAIDSDDGNRLLKARAQNALQQWISLLGKIAAKGIEKGEIRQDVVPTELAMLIVSSLEGALAISRLNRNIRALNVARTHLEQYLETAVRVSARKDGLRI